MAPDGHIRLFREDDARPVADLMRRLVPQYLVTPALILHWLRSAPERAHSRLWVAEVEGRVVGLAWVDLKWWAADPGIGSIFLLIDTPSRRRGLGSALYDAAERHLLDHGAWKLEAQVVDDDGRRFAERRGYHETRRERLSQLDVPTADLSELPELAAAKAAEGVRVVPLRDLVSRARELHALYEEAAKDMPTDDPHGDVDFDEWERETLGNPLLDAEGSMNVLDGDRPVAFAWLLVDREGGRAVHELTGTLRAYRGRGLARLAKLAAIEWCREHGIRTLLTGNDTENAPMLAINDRLGYRPTVVDAEYVRVVGDPPAGGAR
ncbi:MAG: GNAT family N-acetyltransferase [Thermoleophilia bacterium]|nr:GNAT family N-acetyltransferase [Thermoleophilia bacterium]